jgi:hypothetical protein
MAEIAGEKVLLVPFKETDKDPRVRFTTMETNQLPTMEACGQHMMETPGLRGRICLPTRIFLRVAWLAGFSIAAPSHDATVRSCRRFARPRASGWS